MPEMEKELETAVAKAVSEIATERPFKAVAMPQPVSLSEQWVKLEKIQQELKTRIYRERGMIIAEHDRLWAETKSDYRRRIEDAVTKLESQQRDALQNLADATAARLREHDLLAERMARLA